MSTPRPALGDILVSARPFTDYTAQFALARQDLLAGPVLDCPGGASDFAATVRALGGDAHSVDPCYAEPAPRLAQRLDQEFSRLLAWTGAQPDRFTLDADGVWCQAPAWRRAADTFLTDHARDREQGTGHYVPATLPHLPFRDDSFALALSGFLLFTYAARFDRAFHLRAISELLRVAPEARLYPLNDMARRPYPALDPLLADLSAHGIRHELLTVPATSDPDDTLALRLTR